MLARIGEGFLDGAVDGSLGGGCEVGREFAAEGDRESGCGDETGQVVGGGLRGESWTVGPGRAKQGHHRAQFVEGRCAQCPDRRRRVADAVIGGGDVKGTGLHGNQADLVGDDVVHLPGELVALPGEDALGVQFALVPFGGLDLVDPGAQIRRCLHELSEEDRGRRRRELVDERHGGPVLVPGQLLRDGPADRVGGGEKRPADDQEPSASRPHRQREQCDDRGGEDVGHEGGGQSQHEGDQRPAPPDEERGACEDAGGDRERVGIGGVQERIRRGHRDGDQVGHPGRDAPPQPQVAVHSSRCCSVSSPARCAANAA